jgi:hypothetical protein
VTKKQLLGLLLFFFCNFLPILALISCVLCERDSSETTEPPTRTSGAQAVKVMERIARPREAGARPNHRQYHK